MFEIEKIIYKVYKLRKVCTSQLMYGYYSGIIDTLIDISNQIIGILAEVDG